MKQALNLQLPLPTLDRSRQAAPQIADALRDAILALQLPPGAVLVRTEWAERFGVSQTPVRDALLKLGEEGLVDIYPQHATIVSRINVTAARHAHFLRRALELELVRELACREEEALLPVLALLRERIAQQKRALAARDFVAFIAADREFHRVTYEAVGMGELWPLIRQRSAHLDRLRLLHLPARGKAQVIMRDHQAIVDAIAQRQPETAQTALRSHLSGTLSIVEVVRQSHPGWVMD